MKHLHYAANAGAASLGELFDPKTLARSVDPVTSKLAAQTVSQFLSGHHRKIYNALASMIDGTFYQIAEAAQMEPASVWRRLNELEKAGRITQTGQQRLGPTNRLCRVWRATT